MTTDLDSLRGFLRGARGRSQEQIIMEFLDSVIKAPSDSADNGSVLINHPRKQKLVLFNEADFLFEKALLDPTKRSAWPRELGYFEGVAGRCFRQKETKVFDRARPYDRSDFFGNSPIHNMICIPIITGPGDPFGIVCFHNDKAEKKFSTDEIANLEAYVDILALALHTPHPELQLEQNVFIVHGRDEKSLNELQIVLHDNGVTPRVLAKEDKGPQSILNALEDLIRICKAGFILATPDDVGRLASETAGTLTPRARENVIFETGLLFAKYREFKRVSVLLKRPAVLPSDLAGIAYDEFEKISDIEAKLVAKLKAWGLHKE